MDMAAACIISVGDELLSGRTLNTNAHFISLRLEELGISVKRHITVNDDKHTIIKELRTCMKDHDIVFMTGGLGPTDDDITLEAVSEALDMKMKTDRDLIDYLKRRVPDLDKNAMSKLSRKIETSKILSNSEGVVPGQYVYCGHTSIFLLPGVHKEVVSIFNDEIDNMLAQENSRESSSIRLYAIREIEAMNMLSTIFNRDVMDKLAFLPSYGYVDIVLYRRKFTSDESSKVLKSIREHLNEHLLPSDRGSDIAEQLGEMLSKRKLTIAFAESCTGGLLAKQITDFAGSSKYFMGSTVTYSNQAKEDLLGVDKKTLKERGAVSREIAEQMAEGAARVFGADIGVSVTGIAGPGGGSKEKPVGLIYSSIFFRGKCFSINMQFSGSRNTIRSTAAMYILFHITRLINE